MMGITNSVVAAQLENLLGNLGVEADSGLELKVSGSDPVLDTPWRVGEAAATALLAQGILIDKLWRLRYPAAGVQALELDIVAAALSTFRCNYLRQNGYSIPFPDIEYPTVGLYPTGDGKYVFINGGFPKLRRGMLRLLDCADNKEALTRALSKWRAEDIETAAREAGLCCIVCRSAQEWRESAQGAALYAALSQGEYLWPVVIEKIAESPAQPCGSIGAGGRPLSGVKVLDLTHVLAGPTCGMLLAEQGAEVLRINGPQVPSILPFVMDTGHGKRNTQLDLKTDAGRDTLWSLVDSGADIFTESYRPQTFANLGFSPEALAERLSGRGRGIIYVSVNCYGHLGPWRDLPGWEQLAQTGTGLAWEQGRYKEGAPQLLPTFPNDYITGYLAACGILAALLRREVDGGSYHVHVSLCATAMWLQSMGRVGAELLPPAAPDEEAVQSLLLEDSSTGYGQLRYFGHPLQYSVTGARWERPSVPIGFNTASWSK